MLAAVETADGAACQRFMAQVAQEPPEDIAATAEQITLAQDFFFENSFAILQGLLHMSLAGGFARYLLSASRCAADSQLADA